MRTFVFHHENSLHLDRVLVGFAIALAAIVLALLLATAAAAQPAYVSLTGNFLTAGDQHNFVFDLTRPVYSNEVLRFETFANGGGINMAGDTILAGGIDSVLELFDSVGFQRGYDDDGSFINGLDSLLSWPGVAEPRPGSVPLNPNPLPLDSYRLNLSEYLNDAPGLWALDLVGPANAIVVTGESPVGTSAIGSLKAGNGAQVSFSGSYELNAGKSFTFQGGADFTVGSYLDIGNGTNGTLQIRNPGSTLTTNAVSTIFLDWGQAGGIAGVTISDGATANVQADYINLADDNDPNSFGLLTVESGADMTINGLYLGTGSGRGQVDVRGSSSTLTQNGGSTLTIGSTNGILGLMRIADNAVFTSGTGQITVNTSGRILVNDATFNANGNLTLTATGAGGTPTLTVENEGQLNVVGTTRLEGQASVSVAGVGSHWQAGVVIVGDFVSSPQITLSQGATIDSGSVDVLDTALINGYLPGLGPRATWYVNGDVSVGGGGAHLTIEQSGRMNISGALTLYPSYPSENRVTVQSGGELSVGGTLTIPHAGAALDLLDGQITAHSFIVGSSGDFRPQNGTFTVDGGQFRIDAGRLLIDSGSGTPIFRLQNGAQGLVPVPTVPSNKPGVIEVGADGHGRLEILNGASLTSSAGWITSGLAAHPGTGVGHVLVQGENSLWQITGEAVGGAWAVPLTVGENGAGTLEIRDGGQVVTPGTVGIGSPFGWDPNGQGSPGTAIVDGPDTLLRVNMDRFGNPARFAVGKESRSSGARGFLEVSNSGRVDVDGFVTVLDAGTVTLANQGEIDARALNVEQGGILQGDGLVNLSGPGSLKNAGRVSPGGAVPGEISVLGPFEQLPGGQLEIQLGGIGTTQYDLLNVSGTATLAGVMNVSLIGAFFPQYGTAFDVLVSGARAGRFDTMTGTMLAANRWLAPVYRVNDLRLVTALPGDANLDRVVDGSDFIIWNSHKFTSGTDWSTGDFDNNGVTDGSDFIIWNTHKFTSVSMSQVPEPVGTVLMAMACVLAAGRLRRS